MKITPKDMRTGTLHFTNNYGHIIITNYINSNKVLICFLKTRNEAIRPSSSIRSGTLVDKKEMIRKRKNNFIHKKYYVYLASYIGTKCIKIGWTGNIKQRIRTIQSGSPHDIDVIEAFECNSEEGARKLEENMHALCKEYHFKREWFMVDDINSLVSFIKSAWFFKEKQ